VATAMFDGSWGHHSWSESNINHMEGMHMWSSFKILIEDLWLSSNVAVTVTKNRKLLSSPQP
jgi:hypothetical protein